MSNEQFLIGLDAKLCKDYFYHMVRQAWKPCFNEDLIDGWHIGAMCYHLQALVENKLYTADGLVADTLIINIPSGCTKSSVTSVLFPAWLWGKMPHFKMWYESFEPSLAVRDASATRDIVKDDWFNERFWNGNVSISSDQDQKTIYRNTAGGWRMSYGIGMKAGFGWHPNLLVCLPYEEKVATNLGDIEIGRIVEEKIDCQILSFSHESETVEFDSIEEYEKNPGKEILEIEMDDGTVLSVTEDHPVHINGRGYIPAGEIREGDEVLCVE